MGYAGERGMEMNYFWRNAVIFQGYLKSVVFVLNFQKIFLRQGAPPEPPTTLFYIFFKFILRQFCYVCSTFSKVMQRSPGNSVYSVVFFILHAMLVEKANIRY